MKRSLILLALALSTCVLTSCATSPQAVTIKAEDVTVTSVDLAMKGWAIFVNNGKATQQQVDAVKQAYTTYYNAQCAAEPAIEMWVNSGSTNAPTGVNTYATQTQVALLNLINQYLNSK